MKFQLSAIDSATRAAWLIMFGAIPVIAGGYHESPYPDDNSTCTTDTSVRVPPIITATYSTTESYYYSSSVSHYSSYRTSGSVSYHTPHPHNYTSTVVIVPSTITTCTTSTYTPVYTGCPTACSVSAGTVEVVFWPTGNDFLYPSTYIDTALDYTYTSPSLYLIINTIGGYNAAGPTGPSATSIVFALDLDEVSTIVTDSGATRQLTLSDLGTDCPTTAAPSVIATMTAGGSCDPILVAPTKVKSWALPCGACSNFGLFDPPYAIPTINSGLLGTTTTAEPTTTPTTTAVVSSPTSVQSALAPPQQETSNVLCFVLSVVSVAIILL